MSGAIWCIIILALVVGPIGWLLMAPIILVIDTSTQHYALQWRGLVMVRLVSGGRLRLWVMGWTKEIDPWQPNVVDHPGSSKPISKGLPRSLNPSGLFHKVKTVLYTFRIRTCQLELDTGNYVLNAYLYPVLGLLSGYGRRLRINFSGETAVRIVLENRLYRMLFSFLFL